MYYEHAYTNARYNTRMPRPLICLILAFTLLAAFLGLQTRTVYADSGLPLDLATVLCGEGSASENYGFTYNLQQPHWTVDGEGYVSETTLQEVDEILDRLEADNIAQTMILFKPAAQVGDRVNCAVHFLRYMKLGLLAGERKDNGFVFLIVVEGAKIDVHYGVGLGLPALTAPNLTNLNRLAEDTYRSTGSMDAALLALIEGFDEYARSQYAPWYPPEPTAVPIELPSFPEGIAGIGLLCCLVCVSVIVLIIIVIILSRLGSLIQWIPSGSGSPSPWRSGGSRPWRSGGSSSGPRPRMRGGGGSGRSGRGN